jgi:TRAP-type uncharacterized transport system substrate-binding protein
MKSIGTCLLLKLVLLLPMSAAMGQNSLFDLGFPSSTQPFPDNVGSERVNCGIATGSSSGLYIRFGEDIAKLCANYGIPLTSTDPNKFRYPKFRVNVYATQGGFDSVKRLRYEREVQFAIVQSDLRYFAAQRIKDEYEPAKREAWTQIADEIKLILPLYREKVHILVRPADKERFRDLAGLMKAGATVNVGTVSSGGMITCLMIEELVRNSREWKNNSNRSWKPTFHPEDAALDLLTGANVRTGGVDAVILVGGVPYPTLKNYGINTAVKKGLFKNTQVSEPELALLPVGQEIQDILANADFKGYHKDQITVGEYEFMNAQSNEVVDTVGVYACLVSHNSYTDKSAQKHKIVWVRHVLFRILTKLEPGSDYGLPSDFGIPKAGDKWREVQPVAGLTSEAQYEQYYGWPRHEDKLVRDMVDLWSKGQATGVGGGPSTSVVDPIKLF